MVKRQGKTLSYIEITLDELMMHSEQNSSPPPLQSKESENQPPTAISQLILPNGKVATPSRCEAECIRLLERLGRTHGRWEVFSSFIEMYAIIISNQVDIVHFAEREKTRQERASKYSNEEIDIFAQIASILTMNSKISKDDPCDILGPICHKMKLNDEYKGQFFTPQGIGFMMAILMTDDSYKVALEKGYITVCEPCCGSGAMIVGFAKELQQRGLSLQNMVVSATDIDKHCVYMTYIQMSLYGIPAVVTHGNSLTMEKWSCWYTPAYIEGDWHTRLANA